ncbi:MAG: hypothetical protein C5S49_08655 [Candidatus Methanogaster sp.]|nr:MAG: hypothetical protein C5S49_08655 [ANME-2 cluster archaeon]
MKNTKNTKTLQYVLVLLLLSPAACAYDEDDLEWGCGKTKELNLGEGISCGNYTVVAYNFPRSDRKSFVGIKLYGGGVVVSEQMLKAGEDYIHEDEVRITAIELNMAQNWTDQPEEPWAKIRIEPRGLPGFDADFELDKDEYEPYSTIEVDLTIQSIGNAKADDVNVCIDAEALDVVQGKLRHHYSTIARGELLDRETGTDAFDPITLRFDVPSVIEDRTFNLTVMIEYDDIKDTRYSYSVSHPVKVCSMFKFSKSINDNIYMDETATVTISLRNEGTRQINSIVVSDTLPPEFELNGNSTLEWGPDSLGCGEYRSFTYQLKPFQPNVEGYRMPAALAEWSFDGRRYSVHSDSPYVVVYGPKIELSKSATPATIDEGGIVTVTLEAKNTGNMIASIDVADSIPPDTVLTGGVTDVKEVLEAGESHTFSYSMRVDATGSIELPAALLQFVDNREYEGTVVSENVSITVNPVNSQGSSDPPGSQGSPIIATATATQTIATSYKTTGSDASTGEESVVGYRFTFAYMLIVLYAIARITRGREGKL